MLFHSLSNALLLTACALAALCQPNLDDNDPWDDLVVAHIAIVRGTSNDAAKRLSRVLDERRATGGALYQATVSQAILASLTAGLPELAAKIAGDHLPMDDRTIVSRAMSRIHEAGGRYDAAEAALRAQLHAAPPVPLPWPVDLGARLELASFLVRRDRDDEAIVLVLGEREAQEVGRERGDSELIRGLCDAHQADVGSSAAIAASRWLAVVRRMEQRERISRSLLQYACWRGANSLERAGRYGEAAKLVDRQVPGLQDMERPKDAILLQVACRVRIEAVRGNIAHAIAMGELAQSGAIKEGCASLPIAKLRVALAKSFALANNSDGAAFYFEKGSAVLRAEGDWISAAAGDEGGEIDALVGLAGAFTERGEADKATAALQQAMTTYLCNGTVNERLIDILNAKVYLLLRSKDIDGAKDMLGAVHAVRGHFADYVPGQAKLFELSGDVADARGDHGFAYACYANASRFINCMDEDSHGMWRGDVASKMGAVALKVGRTEEAFELMRLGAVAQQDALWEFACVAQESRVPPLVSRSNRVRDRMLAAAITQEQIPEGVRQAVCGVWLTADGLPMEAEAWKWRRIRALEVDGESDSIARWIAIVDRGRESATTAELRLGRAGAQEADAYVNELVQVQMDVRGAMASLALKLQGIDRGSLPHLDSEQLRDCLPENWGFLAISRIDMDSPVARRPPHYAGLFVSRRADNPVVIVEDCGDAAALARDVQECLEQLTSTKPCQESLRRAFRLVSPFAAELRGLYGVCISIDDPGGPLAGFPIELLVDGEGTMLCDRMHVIYTRAQRLCGEHEASVVKRPDIQHMAFFAYPRFQANEIAEDDGETLGTISATNPGRLLPLPAVERRLKSLPDRLRTVGVEVDAFVSEQATEATLCQSRLDGVVHFSTHGYSLVPPVKLQTEADRLAWEKAHFEGRAPISDVQFLANPSARSGIALAGTAWLEFGRDPPAGRDGFVSALNVMSLRLQRTALVVLHGCVTGQGASFEDQLGMRRAARVAGAQGAMFCYWNVHAESSSQLINEFYAEYPRNMAPHDALRKARETIRSADGGAWAHPYYWACFGLDYGSTECWK